VIDYCVAVVKIRAVGLNSGLITSRLRMLTQNLYPAMAGMHVGFIGPATWRIEASEPKNNLLFGKPFNFTPHIKSPRTPWG
jgi:hypothetical protein